MLVGLANLRIRNVIEHLDVTLATDSIVDSAPSRSLPKCSANRKERIDRLQGDRDGYLAKHTTSVGNSERSFLNGVEVELADIVEQDNV